MGFNMQKTVTLILSISLFLLASTASAETYRWKDKEGKVHYGAAVPAEYADMPYDVLNNAGLVVRHVEDSREPLEEVVKEVIKEKSPLIPDMERQRQADRLLVIKYSSEEDITKGLELEIAQVGYDSMLINKSYDSAKTAIRDLVRQAGDQQRSGKAISAEQSKKINKLYRRLNRDEKKLASMVRREERVRNRFMTDLESYRRIQAEAAESLEERNKALQDQG